MTGNLHLVTGTAAVAIASAAAVAAAVRTTQSYAGMNAHLRMLKVTVYSTVGIQ